jgi:fused signal recognition particle receptor
MTLRWFKKNKKGQSQHDGDGPQPLPAPPRTSVDDSADRGDRQSSQAPDAASLAAEDPEPAAAERDAGYFTRLKTRLTKTRQAFSKGFDRIFAGKRTLRDDDLEQLEELLITADIGVQTTMELIKHLAALKLSDPQQVKNALKDQVLSILLQSHPTAPPAATTAKPHVVMVVGVNGVGKTTTIGKLAAVSVKHGQKVLIAASDTFRAAANEQLTIWAERAGAEIVKHQELADPAAVAFDAVAAAMNRGADIVYIDTAGRLHTKVNLMEELKKIKRSVAKRLPGAPHEIWLVLDATTGQNALSQAKLFHDALDVTGIILTKLDGTAKGGIVIRICSEMNLPLKYIGIGEKIEDLQLFDPESFVDALL